jgi:hypothetical protein
MLGKRKSLEEKVEETAKNRKSPETLASQFESEGWKFIDLNKASLIRIIPNGLFGNKFPNNGEFISIITRFIKNRLS